MKEKQREKKLDPMAMAFIPSSSRYCIANNAIPPTNTIAVGAPTGILIIEDGGKAQPSREKTGVSGYSLTIPHENKNNICRHPPDLVDEDASTEDDDNLPELSTLIGNKENGKAAGNPVTHDTPLH